jgi:hypothetical protein
MLAAVVLAVTFKFRLQLAGTSFGAENGGSKANHNLGL